VGGVDDPQVPAPRGFFDDSSAPGRPDSLELDLAPVSDSRAAPSPFPTPGDDGDGAGFFDDVQPGLGPGELPPLPPRRGALDLPDLPPTRPAPGGLAPGGLDLSEPPELADLSSPGAAQPASDSAFAPGAPLNLRPPTEPLGGAMGDELELAAPVGAPPSAGSFAFDDIDLVGTSGLAGPDGGPRSDPKARELPLPSPARSDRIELPDGDLLGGQLPVSPGSGPASAGSVTFKRAPAANTPSQAARPSRRSRRGDDEAEVEIDRDAVVEMREHRQAAIARDVGRPKLSSNRRRNVLLALLAAVAIGAGGFYGYRY
jgi:hypothetical protein